MVWVELRGFECACVGARQRRVHYGPGRFQAKVTAFVHRITVTGVRHGFGVGSDEVRLEHGDVMVEHGLWPHIQ